MKKILFFCALIVLSIQAHAGSEGRGGGHIIGNQLYDDALNSKEATEIDITNLPLFDRSVRPVLEKIGKLVPGFLPVIELSFKSHDETPVGSPFKTQPKKWFIDSRPLQCPLVGLVKVEGAWAGACQDNFEIRIAKKIFTDSKLTERARRNLIVHEMVRAVAMLLGLNDDSIEYATTMLVETTDETEMRDELSRLGFGYYLTGSEVLQIEKADELISGEFAKSKTCDDDLHFENIARNVASPLYTFEQKLTDSKTLDFLGYHLLESKLEDVRGFGGAIQTNKYINQCRY